MVRAPQQQKKVYVDLVFCIVWCCALKGNSCSSSWDFVLWNRIFWLICDWTIVIWKVTMIVAESWTFRSMGWNLCEKVGLISCNQSSRPATDPIRLLLRSLFCCNPKVASLWNHSVRKDQYLKGQCVAVFSKEEVKSWLKPWSIQGLYSLDSCYESLCYDPNAPVVKVWA